MIYLDLAKTFYTVNHGILLKKMETIDILRATVGFIYFLSP